MDEMEIARKITHLFYTMRKESLMKPSNNHKIGHRDIMMLDAIMRINAEGDLVKMSDISTYFNVTPAAISQMIKTFENKNWVERILLENDRRSVYIKVTKEAKEMINGCEKHMSDKLLLFIEELGAEDAQAFIRILEKASIFYKKENECKQKGNDE
ncbi:MAG: MarR family transcriptional regulator [Longicatena sp.]